MSVDPQKLMEMNRILEAMNNAVDFGAASDEEFVDSDDLYGDEPTGPAYVANVSPGAIDEMKKILEAFHGAQASTPVEDPEVREALATKPVEDGVQIGSWKITKKQLGETARYDVVHSGTGSAIAQDLYLYDAALGLVRALNEGVSITSTRVRNLLKLEEDFARNVDDAVTYKARARKLREAADEKRAAVAEDRSDEAERQAEAARDRILRLAGLRS
jgi:hypothetical protein